jgi:hypothetical protein
MFGRSVLGVAVALLAAVVALALLGSTPEAQAAVCPAGAKASVTTIHTNCWEAATVLEKALARIPTEKFRVYVRGWWHCFYTEIGGLPTLTAERGYGTPSRQAVIVVTE